MLHNVNLYAASGVRQHKSNFINVVGFKLVAKFESFTDTISSSPSNPGAYLKALYVRRLKLLINHRTKQVGGVSIYDDMFELTRDQIKTIGEHCPTLKSFQVTHVYTNGSFWEDVAFQSASSL